MGARDSLPKRVKVIPPHTETNGECDQTGNDGGSGSFCVDDSIDDGRNDFPQHDDREEFESLYERLGHLKRGLLPLTTEEVRPD